jgi:CBS domain-containing protein
MKVKDVMRSTVISCRPDTNLAEAVDLLWSSDCGILPVIDAAGKVCGVITDRDICVAVGTRNRVPGDLRVKEVAASEIVTCKPEDDVRSALDVMRDNQVRRLPVVDAADVLKGILSIADIILRAESADGKKELSFNDVMPAFKAICQRHAAPEPLGVPAAA